MDLKTRYLGLELESPFIPGASPLVDDLDMVRRIEDAGAAAIVMHSLFEEQITGEQLAVHSHVDHPSESFAEAITYHPRPEAFRLGPEEYLEQLRRIKDAVSVPVIASLNGVTEGGWLEYARLLEEAGASALELNTYQVSTDPDEEAETIESRILRMLHLMKSEVRVPVALKLSPFHTALASFARRLEATGADGLVLFNRFYQPDIDIEELDVARTLTLSDSSELLLRVRWLAVLSAQRSFSLAASGGVHTAVDAIKALMAGAHVIQMVSALLLGGPEHLGRVKAEVETWLKEREYDSVQQLIGSMNLARSPNPKSYERAQYVELLQSWKDFA
jgi:dihydroorotate dehydrogenase (fumarate)